MSVHRDTEAEAVRLLRRLMEDAFIRWRTLPESRLTIAEQQARRFLLERER